MPMAVWFPQPVDYFISSFEDARSGYSICFHSAMEQTVALCQNSKNEIHELFLVV